MEGEGHDRFGIDLPGNQSKLVLEVSEARHALVARRILPNLLVLAGACPLMFWALTSPDAQKGARIRV